METTSDDQTTVDELKREVAVFVRERDWEQFHSPENLALSLSLEAAELLELFQWKLRKRGAPGEEECRENSIPPLSGRGYPKVELGKMQMELSDILIYLISFFNRMDWDITSCFHRKMELNRKKYPAELFKGKFDLEDMQGRDTESKKEDLF